MNKEYLSKEGQIYDFKNCLPIDAILGPWNNIEDFESFIVNKLGISVNQLPAGTCIRIVDINSIPNKVTDYYRINNAWTDNLEELRKKLFAYIDKYNSDVRTKSISVTYEDGITETFNVMIK